MAFLFCKQGKLNFEKKNKNKAIIDFEEAKKMFSNLMTMIIIFC
jgi:hypothetical protein